MYCYDLNWMGVLTQPIHLIKLYYYHSGSLSIVLPSTVNSTVT